jgi:hypothetical protein
MSETHDWGLTKDTLIAGSISAFKAFFAVHPIETVRAIGYTWEWGQPQAAFYCVANTQRGLEQGMVECNRYRVDKLNEEQARMEVRWSAGYFSHPAGLVGPSEELGTAWTTEANKLYALTESMRPTDPSDDAQYAVYTENYEAFLASLVSVCCEALAEIAKSGLFENAQQMDFWVGSTDDERDCVRDRDTRVRQLIARGNARE